MTVTVTVAAREVAVCVAVITDVPAATAVINPLAFTVATAVVADEKVTPLVSAAVEASLYVPVTVSCRVAAGARLIAVGVRAIDVSVGAGVVTVTVAVADLPDAVAVIVAVPAPTPVTTPALDTDAIDVDDEVKFTPDVSAPFVLLL